MRLPSSVMVRILKSMLRAKHVRQTHGTAARAHGPRQPRCRVICANGPQAVRRRSARDSKVAGCFRHGHSPDCRDERRREAIVGEAQQQTALAHARVADQQQFLFVAHVVSQRLRRRPVAAPTGSPAAAVEPGVLIHAGGTEGCSKTHNGPRRARVAKTRQTAHGQGVAKA